MLVISLNKSFNDGRLPGAPTSFLMPFSSCCRLAALTFLLFGLAPRARAQSDQLNLEGGFGTRLEDAYATAYLNRELQLPVTYRRSRDGKNLLQYVPTLEIGPFRNTQFSVGVPVYSGNGDRTGSGNVVADAFYNFNTEGIFVPAMAVAGELTLPTGRNSRGTDYSGSFILTKSILPMLGLHRLHANLVYRRNNQPRTTTEGTEVMTERLDRWALLVGYSGRILPQATLIVDFVREELPLRGKLGSSLEAGLRRQMNPRMVLSGGVAAGLGTDADKFRANLAIQQSF